MIMTTIMVEICTVMTSLGRNLTLRLKKKNVKRKNEVDLRKLRELQLFQRKEEDQGLWFQKAKGMEITMRNPKNWNLLGKMKPFAVKFVSNPTRLNLLLDSISGSI